MRFHSIHAPWRFALHPAYITCNGTFFILIHPFIFTCRRCKWRRAAPRPICDLGRIRRRFAGCSSPCARKAGSRTGPCCPPRGPVIKHRVKMSLVSFLCFHAQAYVAKANNAQVFGWSSIRVPLRRASYRQRFERGEVFMANKEGGKRGEKTK